MAIVRVFPSAQLSVNGIVEERRVGTLHRTKRSDVFMEILYETRHSGDMPPDTTRPYLRILASLLIAVITTGIFAAGARVLFYGIPASVLAFIPEKLVPVPPQAVQSPFTYSFKKEGIVFETGSSEESTDPYVWLNSGAKLVRQANLGMTLQGALTPLDIWRIRYLRANALDTENGYEPQNLFHLITRSSWENVRSEASFRIVRDNFTESPQRNALNGLLLLSQYQDSDNFYYAGIRVDGRAVIKKKYNGSNITLIEKVVFPGEYVREKDVNLLPHKEWIRLRMETTTDSKGRVLIVLSLQRGKNAKWDELLRIVDDGKKFNETPPLTGSYPVGIRTDFMDVEFDAFTLTTIETKALSR